MMADYTACMRSNSFKVKDIEAFKKAIEDKQIWMDDIEVIVENGEVTLAGYTFIPFNCGDGEDFDFAKFIQEHLVEGEKAVIMEIGHEKLRYLNAIQFIITKDRIEEKTMYIE
jgi:hypothetical protein